MKKPLCLLFIVSVCMYLYAQETNYKEKIQELTAQIAKQPDNLLLYYQRADLYDIVNDFGGANRDYGKVLHLYYQSAENKKYAGEYAKSCYLLADDYYFRKSDEEKALEFVNAGLKVLPGFKSLEVLEAKIFSRNLEKQELALEKYAALAEKYPNDTKIVAGYVALLDKSNPEKSITYYEELASADPVNADILFKLGIHYTKLAGELYQSGENLEKANTYTEKGTAYFEQYLELHPEDKEVMGMLLQYYQFLHRTQDAEAMKERL